MRVYPSQFAKYRFTVYALAQVAELMKRRRAVTYQDVIDETGWGRDRTRVAMHVLADDGKLMRGADGLRFTLRANWKARAEQHVAQFPPAVHVLRRLATVQEQPPVYRSRFSTDYDLDGFGRLLEHGSRCAGASA